MSQSALYLGTACPPNMEAYLDSLLFRTQTDNIQFDLLAAHDCDLPVWLTDEERIHVRRYFYTAGSGFSRARVASRIVRQYLQDYDPDEIRQITQPRWHAPGVLAGAVTSDVPVFTRASRSLFREYREAPSPVRAWLVNNLLGRAIFFGNRLYTPRHGAVSVPWWAPAEKVVEERVVNADRFSPEAAPKEDLFKQSRRRVVTVGRISRQKGTDLLLDVADQLEEHEFALVGPVGDESLAAKADATPNVTRHPPVEYIDMPSVYAAADVTLSASRIEWGGVSRAMMEGAAMGLPVVALDQEEASSIADVTVSEDPEAIATAITDFTAP